MLHALEYEFPRLIGKRYRAAGKHERAGCHDSFRVDDVMHCHQSPFSFPDRLSHQLANAAEAHIAFHLRMPHCLPGRRPLS